jgi:hypothetical protein
MAVPIGPGAAGSTDVLAHGSPQPLVGSIPTVGNVSRFTYQPSADGQKFLVAVPLADAAPLTVVLNWHASIGR